MYESVHESGWYPLCCEFAGRFDLFMVPKCLEIFLTHL
ncbi:hypothetical protein ANCDUO_18273 [Ancylostoma duodenale]|uniref:Uncharacterized protein n=1 Tax=Ancylostoma duodenale TaxID=51022 RepID=A0A0C2FSS7_9BILA|nr:hypothetical protein ANCDUO_18273 [Ancylostoma duodenale]